MCAREKKRESPSERVGKVTRKGRGVTWGKFAVEKEERAKARTRRWHCAACIDVATLHKGGDDAEEELNAGG